MTTKALSLIPPDVESGGRDLTDAEWTAFAAGLHDTSPEGLARLMATFGTDDPVEARSMAAKFLAG